MEENTKQPEIPAEHNEENNHQANSAFSELLKLAEKLDVWQSTRGDTWVTLPKKKHVPVESGQFGDHLTLAAHRRGKAIPSEHQIGTVKRFLRAKAMAESTQYVVHSRVAYHDESIIIDLNNNEGEVIHVSKTDWKVTTDCPARFHRPKGMHALPRPTKGTSIEALCEIANVQAGGTLEIAAAWLVCALRCDIPKPILAVNAAAGSGKTALSNVLLKLIDHRDVGLRPLPYGEDDFKSAAANSYCLGFDNISGMRPKQADMFCQAATGISFTAREKYSNANEHAVKANNPILMNGIPDFTSSRSDLVSRCFPIRLPPIKANTRKTMEALNERFAELHGGLLGALCDGLQSGLANSATVELESGERMADAMNWVEACQIGWGWPSGHATNFIREAQNEVRHEGLATNQYVMAVQKLLSNRETGEWHGTANELVGALNCHWDANCRVRLSDRTIKGELRRVEGDLGLISIGFEEPKRTAGGRLIRLYSTK